MRTGWRGVRASVAGVAAAFLLGACGGGGGSAPDEADVLPLPGAPDLPFGTNGAFTLNLPFEEKIAAVLVQPDGRIVVAGTVRRSATNSDMFVLRLLDDGTYDPSFSSVGFHYVDFGGVDEAFGLARRASDGAVVVVGRTDIAGAGAVAVGVVTAAGDPDLLFDTDGRLTLDLTIFPDEAAAVVVQPDDMIVLAGTVGVSSTSNMLVARLTPTGALDPAFHGGTYASLTWLNREEAHGLALDPITGNLLVAGSTDFTGLLPPRDFAVARLLPTGEPDLTFGVDGQTTVDFGFDDVATAVQVDLVGRVLVSGTSTGAPGTSPDAVVARLTAVGTLDAAYNATASPTPSDGNGRRSYHALASPTSCAASLLQTDGLLVLAGDTGSGGGVLQNVFVSRLEADGALDGGFRGGNAPHGVSVVGLGADERATAVARDGLGRLVVAGTTTTAGVPQMLLVRLGGGTDVDQALESWSTPVAAPVQYGAFDRAMTFTVGRTGDLRRVELNLMGGLPLGPPGDVAFEVRALVGGTPDPVDANVLVTRTLSSSAWAPFGQWVTVDLSLPVTEGQRYALVLRSLAPGSIPSWLGSANPSDYAGGDAYYRDLMLSSSFLAAGADLGFRTHVR